NARMYLGHLKPRDFFSGSAHSVISQVRRLRKLLQRGIFSLPQTIDPATTMPSEEPNRTAEAIRRVLPELLKLDRYERRAFAGREGAVKRLSRIISIATS